MALTFPYRFAVAMFAENGASLGTVPAKLDWEPLQDWTRFTFQRRGQLSLAEDGGASVLPLWDHELGEPYCKGFRIQIHEPGRRPVASDFPTTQFHDFAAAVASVYVEQQKLRAGEYYTYMLVAHPAASAAPVPGGLLVKNASPNLPVQDTELEKFLAGSKPSGVLDSADMPVFVAPQVLEQAAEQTHANHGIETGGILIGLLRRDLAAGEIFAEVTAQIPAEYTTGSTAKLTFTPQTWAAAQAALRLRGRGEINLGYWHSHPVFEFCKGKQCTPESQKTCPYAKDFFSADDVAVMRAAFPRAYCIAIVANHTAFTDLTFSMFGNRGGATQPRGFYVLEEMAHGA